MKPLTKKDVEEIDEWCDQLCAYSSRNMIEEERVISAKEWLKAGSLRSSPSCKTTCCKCGIEQHIYIAYNLKEYCQDCWIDEAFNIE